MDPLQRLHDGPGSFTSTIDIDIKLFVRLSADGKPEFYTVPNRGSIQALGQFAAGTKHLAFS